MILIILEHWSGSHVIIKWIYLNALVCLLTIATMWSAVLCDLSRSRLVAVTLLSGKYSWSLVTWLSWGFVLMSPLPPLPPPPSRHLLHSPADRRVRPGISLASTSLHEHITLEQSLWTAFSSDSIFSLLFHLSNEPFQSKPDAVVYLD